MGGVGGGAVVALPNSLVRHPNMYGTRVRFTVHRDRLDAQPLARADNAARDLTAIGDQHLAKKLLVHGVLACVTLEPAEQHVSHAWVAASDIA